MGWDSSHLSSSVLFNLGAVAVAWCSGSPSAAPSNAGLAGAVGHRLFEFRGGLRLVQAARASFDDRSTSRVAQGTSGSWGALSFGYLFFGQAKKSNSLKKRKETFKKTTNTWAFMPTLQQLITPEFRPTPQ